MPDELVSQKLEKLVLSKLSIVIWYSIYTLTNQIVGGFIKVQDGKSLCNFEKINKCWAPNKWLWKMFMEK